MLAATTPGQAQRLSPYGENRAALDGADFGDMVTLSEMEVQADQVQRHAFVGNMDLVRTQDDIQPYSIIGRARIERSGANTVEELLSQQLTMGTGFTSSDNSPGGFSGPTSKISLRGMGADQTLVLVNGRRVAGVGSRGASEGSDQADLNGIPLSAIERIEVLPASASAIYGSGALGGVINVVLRQDYSGHELNTRYEATDDGRAPTKTVNFTSSFQLENGRTQILLSGQYLDSEALHDRDRGFQLKGREQKLRNNPDNIYVPAGRTGNPPAGARVNIRSRLGRPLFGPGSSHFTHIPLGYRGWQLDGLQPLIDNQGRYNLDMAEDALNGFTGDRVLVGSRRAKSTNLSVRRQMSEALTLFTELGWAETQQTTLSTYYGSGVQTLLASSPHNPFGQDVVISFPVRHRDRSVSPLSHGTVRQHRAAFGFEWALPRDWRLVGDYSWSSSYNDYTYPRAVLSRAALGNAINAGAVNVLRDTTSFYTDIDSYAQLPHTLSKAWNADTTLRAAGPLATWYAGDITLASGIEHRQIRSFGYPEHSLPRRINYRRQSGDSLYVETTLPVLAPAQRIPALHAVDLQMAWRHERFDVETAGNKFDTTVPTFGLRWLPVEELIVRGSWGKGFRAPNYSQLADPTLSSDPSTVNDPKRGNEENDQVFTLSGGNPDIEPETSRNFNLGLVWTPQAVPGLRLSADWYKIEKKNKITSLGAQAILNEEDLFPGRVLREAAANGDPYGVGRITQVNTYAMNMLSMETAGVDLAARYLWKTAAAGDFDFGVNGTFTDYYRDQTARNGPLRDWVGIPSRNSNTPIDTRLGANLSWFGKQWSAGWAAQYYSAYEIDPGSTTAILEQGGNQVASQVYHDVFVRYRLAAHHRFIGGLELTLGAKNVFDKAPPLDMSRTTFFYSTFGDPRLRRLYVNAKLSF